MILHDYCCCAGLGADGYASVLGAQAIKGFDHEPQPDYPYDLDKADVMEMLVDGLPPADGRHFSFPCQIHTTAGHLRTAQGGTSKYLDLLTPGLSIVRKHYNDVPWVMENVDDRSGNVRKIMAPRDGETLIMLCGTMFGLPIWRHRLFLANFPLRRPEPTGPGVYGAQGCRHDLCEPDPITGRPRPWGIYHVPADSVPSGGRTCRDEEHARQVMGSTRLLPWDKIKEGFPPAYTAWVAADLLTHLGNPDVQH
jgi:hypothetical protein